MTLPISTQSTSKTIPILKKGCYYFVTVDGQETQKMILEDVYREYDGPMCTFTSDNGKNVHAIVLEDELRGICMEKFGTVEAIL